MLLTGEMWEKAVRYCAELEKSGDREERKI